MSDQQTDLQSPINASRYEKSLGLMATRFVALLQNAEGGSLDLKLASDILNVRQKRRIYDITNVLEGIGLIEKKSKNIVQWRGSLPRDEELYGSEIKSRLDTIKKDIECMKILESQLDLFVGYIETNLKNIKQDVDTENLIYVSYQNLQNVFPDDNSLMIVRAPSDTTVEIKNPSTNYNLNQISHSPEYCLSLTAPKNEIIDLFLFDQFSNDEKVSIVSNEISSVLPSINCDQEQSFCTPIKANFNESNEIEMMDSKNSVLLKSNQNTPFKKIHFDNSQDFIFNHNFDGSDFLTSLNNKTAIHEQLNFFYQNDQ